MGKLFWQASYLVVHIVVPTAFLSSRYPNATVLLPPRIHSPFLARARLRLAAPALRASALISLHPARYRVPLSCPFHLPCTSLATNRPFRPLLQVKIHDSLPTTHLRPTYYQSTTYSLGGLRLSPRTHSGSRPRHSGATGLRASVFPSLQNPYIRPAIACPSHVPSMSLAPPSQQITRNCTSFK